MGHACTSGSRSPSLQGGGAYLCSSSPGHPGRSPRHRSSGSCPRCCGRCRGCRCQGTPCTRSRLEVGGHVVRTPRPEALRGSDPLNSHFPSPGTPHLQDCPLACPPLGSHPARASPPPTHLYRTAGRTASPGWRSPVLGGTGWQTPGSRAPHRPRTQRPRQPRWSSSKCPSGTCRAGGPHSRPRPSAGNTAPAARLHRVALPRSDPGPAGDRLPETFSPTGAGRGRGFLTLRFQVLPRKHQ